MALTNTQIVTNDYNDILFDTTYHAGDIAVLAADMTASPTVYTPSYVANSISTAPEMNIVDYVYSLFSSVLGVTLTTANIAGLKYWVQQVELQPTMTATVNGVAGYNIINGVLTTQAKLFLDQSFNNAAVTAGTLATSPTLLVDQLFLQGLNNANPTATAVQYWVTQYNNVLATNGAAYATNFLFDSFANSATAVNATGIATVFATAAQTDTGSGATYTSYSAPVSNSTFTLTTGQDTATAGTFYGTLTAGTSSVGPTLNGFDVLTGTSGGSNTLNLTDSTTGSTTVGDSLPVGLTLSNVQNIILATSNNAGLDNTAGAHTSVFNVSAISGLTSLSVTSSGADGDNIKAAATTNVTDTYNGTGGTNDVINVVGGNGVTVTDNGAVLGVTIGGGTTATDPAGAVTVTENGTGSAAVTVQGGTSVTVTTAATGGVTIGSTVAPSGAVTVTDTGGSDTIGISGGTSATVTATSTAGSIVNISGVTAAVVVTETSVKDAAGTAISVTGGTTVGVTTTGGAVTVGSASTSSINPSGAVTITDNTGNAVNPDNLAAYGVGPVTITTTAAASTTPTITVGTTTSTYDQTSGTVTVVDDTVAGSSTYYGLQTTSIYTSGATAVSLTGGGNTTGVITDEGTTATLATVTLTGVAGTETIGSAAATGALANLTIANSAVKVNGATPTATTASVSGIKALALSLSGDGSGTTLTDSDNAITTLTVTATGTSNAIAIADTGLKTLSLTNNGSSTLTLSSDSSTAAQTVTVAGTGAVALGNLDGTAPSHITAISGTGSSGAITAQFLGSNSTTFTGGSGANVVQVDTSTTAASGGASITVNGVYNGGSGSSNTLILTDKVADYTYTGVGSAFSNFQTLQLGSNGSGSSWVSSANGSYGTNGFAALSIGSVVGASTAFTGVASGVGLTFAASPGNISSFTVGTYGATDTFVYSIGGANGTAHAAVAGGTAAGEATNIAAFLNTAGNASNDYFYASGATVYAIGALTAFTITDATTAGNLTGGGVGTVTAGNAPTGAGTVSSNSVTYTLSTAAAAGTSNSLPVTIGSSSTTGLGSSTLPVTVSEISNQTLAVTSVSKAETYSGQYVNYLTIGDATQTVAGGGNNNPATSLTVSGSGEVVLAYSMTAGSNPATDALRTINASASTAAVTTTAVTLATTGTISITGGSGKLTATGTSGTTTTETITTGSGGGAITVGLSQNTNTGTGTETINVAASTVADTLIDVASGYATIQGFHVTTSASTADVLQFDAAKAVVANVAAGSAVNAHTGGGTFTISNGVLTFSAAEATSAATQLSDVEYYLNNTAGYTNKVVSFVNGSTTYVVADTAAQTVATDEVFALSNVTGVTGLGTTAATNTVVVNSLTGVTQGSPGTALSASGTINDAGYAVDSLVVAAGGSATTLHGVDSYTFQSLASSAIITLDSNQIGGNAHIGDIVVTQATTTGNSLTVTFGAANAADVTTADTLTINGDVLLTLTNSATGTGTVTSLIDNTNTLTTINITGANPVTLGGVTSSSLTTIDAHTATGTVTVTDAIAAQTIKIPTATGNIVLTANGAGDTITQAVAATTSGLVATGSTMNGAGDTITLGGSGANNFTANGAGDHITLGTGAETVVATGAGDVITLSSSNGAGNTISVGSGAAVTLGTGDAGNSVINLYTSGTANVGSGATANITVITNIHENATGTELLYANQGGATTAIIAAAAVDVGSASTIASALNIAAKALGAGTSGQYDVDWFQFQGNTYVVEHISTGAAESTINKADFAVEVTGLVNLANLTGTAAAGALVHL